MRRPVSRIPKAMRRPNNGKTRRSTSHRIQTVTGCLSPPRGTRDGGKLEASPGFEPDRATAYVAIRLLHCMRDGGPRVAAPLADSSRISPSHGLDRRCARGADVTVIDG